MKHLELLLRAPLFAAMPPKVVGSLRTTRKRLAKGQRVAGRGAVVMLVTGRLEVVAGGTLVRSLLPPAVVGLSVAAGAEPTAELVAAEETELLVVPADDVVAALKRHPEAGLHLGGVIAELSSEVAALRVHGLASRVRHRLEQLGRGRREVENHPAEVGGTRAIRPYNVSRALAQLEREGIVQRRRGRIELRGSR